MKPTEDSVGQNDTRNVQKSEKRNKKNSLSKALRGVPRGMRGEAVRNFRKQGTTR